jgi:GST-like protein
MRVAEKSNVIKWLFPDGVWSMFGQLGYFTKVHVEIEDASAGLHRGKRLLAVVEAELDGKDWIAGSFSIADTHTYALAECAGILRHTGGHGLPRSEECCVE